MSVTRTAEFGGYPPNIDNPDDWAAFLARYLDNRATNAVHNGIGLVALHIVDAIQDARRGVKCVLLERMDAAQAVVVASGHTLDDSVLLVAALENSDVHLVRSVINGQ